MKRYTLDRLDDSFYVFVEKGAEENQLLIPENEVTVSLTEGTIVQISKDESGYHILKLEKETADRKQEVADLIEKLKNKH
ncbi:DUF3006 family protein [Planomicrobium sp. YIM 101495]|uniref:DUF3006 family protein n=1 Tax=Planomicrobium sp. YIM 101495 TaxID=2665160 RepID=UPI0018A8B829|nr:DUF3006 family protein [Planomicrobium sp. YIM 101495]